jgi:hypothetical protein
VLEAPTATHDILESIQAASPGAAAPPEPTTSTPGDEESLDDSLPGDAEEPAAIGTVFTHAPAEPAEVPEHLRRREDITDPADELPKVPTLDEFDIAYEVERLLQNRRWETREEPFKGFKSPPGRF